MLDAVFVNASSSTSARTTCMPSCTQRSARARPMPLAAPVMTATLPSNSFMVRPRWCSCDSEAVAIDLASRRTGDSLDRPVRGFSPVRVTGHRSAEHPPTAGIGHLADRPLPHPPEARSRVKRKAVRPLSPWHGRTACPDSGHGCARRSHRLVCRTQSRKIGADGLTRTLFVAPT